MRLRVYKPFAFSLFFWLSYILIVLVVPMLYFCTVYVLVGSSTHSSASMEVSLGEGGCAPPKLKPKRLARAALDCLSTPTEQGLLL